MVSADQIKIVKLHAVITYKKHCIQLSQGRDIHLKICSLLRRHYLLTKKVQINLVYILQGHIEILFIKIESKRNIVVPPCSHH